MSEQSIQIKNLCKSFNNIPVLKNVNITMEAGRVYAIVGKNGAGKSTLVKILAGIHAADSGEIYFKNQKMNVKNPKEALNLGWSFLFQDLELFDNLTIAENVYFNNFPRGYLGIVSKRKIAQMAEELARTVGLKTSCEEKVGRLSMGEKHLVAFMRMLARDAEVMVLDEVSSALTNEDAKLIFEVIKKTKSQGQIHSVCHAQHEGDFFAD